MRDIWSDYFLNFRWGTHFHAVFVLGDDELESPEPVFRRTESAAHGWTLRVTKEPKLSWEK